MPNSATLVQALGAAFCAILFALSGMGGGGMMIGARTAAWAKAGVPYLRRVAYLHSDGNQWIDTGIIPDNSTDITIDLFLYSQQPSGARGLLYVTGNYGLYFDGSLRYSFGKSSWLTVGIYTGRHEIKLLATELSILIDGVKKISINDAEIVTENTIKTSGWNRAAVSDIYGFSISKNKISVQKQYPVLDLSGRPAMYDEVSGQLFYNQGTGEFSWGELGT